MKNVFVVRVDDYLHDLCEITIPTIMDYANKIGANFIEITDRKYPDFPPTYEKLQIYNLGNKSDWNILIDADYLIHPSAPDFTGGLDSEYVGFMEGFDLKNLFKVDDVFKNDGRFMGIATNFMITSRYNHNIWKPLNMSWNDAKKLTKRNFIIDEYCVSHNLAEYGYKFTGLKYCDEISYLFQHLNVETGKVNKNETLKKAIEIKNSFI